MSTPAVGVASASVRAALAEPDPAIEALSGPARERIGLEWARRAEVELTAAALSAQIARGLLIDGAVIEVLELAASAVSEELEHAQICRLVAERYLARALPPPRARPIDEPVFGDASPAVSRLLGLVLHSCINETMATLCLREGLKSAESSSARAATRQLLADDVNHARLGWAHLASPHIDAERRFHVQQALPTLVRLGRECWLNEARADFDDPAHGVLGQTRFLALTERALSELVLPGFAHLGFDLGAARALCGSFTD